MASIKDDFKAFVNRGNLVQLAIAFVMGAAFTALVTALVTDIFTPLIGIAGHFNFSAWRLTINGSALMQGAFLNSVISFVIVVLVVFFAIALPYQRYQDRQAAKAKAAAPTTKQCPECLSTIPLGAKKCAFCTSLQPPPAAPAAAATATKSA